MNQYKQPILDKVREVVELASELYDFPIKFEDINIKWKNKGRAAAQASYDRRRLQYGLAFQLESAHVDIDEMLNDTIPHEVAHLVNFWNPSTGTNHDYGWKRVCIRLGGTGNRTHSQVLTKAKYRKIYLYVTDSGDQRIVKSAAKHRRIQKGVRYRICNTGEWYGASNFVRTISSEEHRQMHEGVVQEFRAARGVEPVTETKKVTKKKTPAKKKTTRSTTGVSKKEQASAMFKSLQKNGEPRSTIIRVFMDTLSMSKAGASTYYANFNSGRW